MIIPQYLTCRYFAPEYLMHGIVDEKTDVYSFGVLLLEIITGRRALDDLNQSLVLWVNLFIFLNDLLCHVSTKHEKPQHIVISCFVGKAFA